jgi:hypothetical protein
MICGKSSDATPGMSGQIIPDVAIALRQWQPDGVHHDRGKPDDQHRFLGDATFLIAIIAAVSSVVTAMPLILPEGCQ